MQHGVYRRILMERMASRIECEALRASPTREAKRAPNPNGSVNGRPQRKPGVSAATVSELWQRRARSSELQRRRGCGSWGP